MAAKLMGSEPAFFLQVLIRACSEIKGRPQEHVRALIDCFDVFAGENYFKVRGRRVAFWYWGADVWWVFEGNDARYAYPQGATGEQEVMDAFKLRLPGFDWEAVIRAQGSTDNARFVCWEKGAKG